MNSYMCMMCGYIYNEANGDPSHGVEPGTSFADVPTDWFCPVCGTDKGLFEYTE